MANFKKGGGNKPQKYNLENGQYIDGDDYIDNFDGNEYIFPESDFHSEDYASFYLTNCFNCKIKDVSDNKINNYLLTYKTKNDKSRLLSFMGYNLNTSKLLKKI